LSFHPAAYEKLLKQTKIFENAFKRTKRAFLSDNREPQLPAKHAVFVRLNAFLKIFACLGVPEL